MEIKHVHPEYESKEARMEKLKDVRRSCIEQISDIRRHAPRRGTGTT